MVEFICYGHFPHPIIQELSDLSKSYNEFKDVRIHANLIMNSSRDDGIRKLNLTSVFETIVQLCVHRRLIKVPNTFRLTSNHNEIIYIIAFFRSPLFI